MNMYRRAQLTLAAACATVSTFAQQSPSLDYRELSAPPTPPPAITGFDESAPEPRLRSAATFYDIGDPTPEEQLYIEMINRARANPTAEADLFATTTDTDVLANYDFFNVDLELMRQQFALIPAAPPVAPNPQLTAAARRHSEDMLEFSYQEHVGMDGSTFATRIADAGYTGYSLIAENVYANADSVFQGHAGFEVDWGPGVGGMQTPPGHRTTIHNPGFREVGVGVIFGQNSPAPGNTAPKFRNVGPSLVTQEFGSRHGATPLITGVVYFDLNGNNFYDLGEGVGGVNVSVSGTATQAVTARSGGYAVPVAGNGNYTVTFSGPNVATSSQSVTVASSQNVKVDFRPTYTAPTLSGTTSPITNKANLYNITPVPAAAAYQWRSFQLTAPVLEGAESGTNTVTLNTFGDYAAIQGTTKKTGNSAFQLATPSGAIREQSFTLNARYLVNANSTLRFQSRLGWATSTTFARVLVSTNDGATWTEVYNQAGTTGLPGEASFQALSVNLSAYAGSIIKVRFSFLPTGSSYIDINGSTGWFIDDILLENGSQISNEQLSAEITNPSFTFAPPAINSFVLQARARTGHNYLPWGPMLNVQAAPDTGAPLVLSASSIEIENGRAIIEVDLVSGTAPTSWSLESSSSVNGGWSVASTSAEVVSATRVRFDVLVRASDTQKFYRVVAN